MSETFKITRLQLNSMKKNSEKVKNCFKYF
jgi:hypothetical protein